MYLAKSQEVFGQTLLDRAYDVKSTIRLQETSSALRDLTPRLLTLGRITRDTLDYRIRLAIAFQSHRIRL